MSMFRVRDFVYALDRANARSLSRSPVFVVSNVLLVSSPPALTLAQVHQSSLLLPITYAISWPIDHPSGIG